MLRSCVDVTPREGNKTQVWQEKTWSWKELILGKPLMRFQAGLLFLATEVDRMLFVAFALISTVGMVTSSRSLIFMMGWSAGMGIASAKGGGEGKQGAGEGVCDT